MVIAYTIAIIIILFFYFLFRWGFRFLLIKLVIDSVGGKAKKKIKTYMGDDELD